ncbi:response regulator [Candidatus Poribacteria bacterium]|nr:response regulator [Candidatus Poribacteria bacterium]
MRNPNPKTVEIVYAEDNQIDRMMVQEALKESRLINPVRFVDNGEELMDYLYRRGKYSDMVNKPLPGLILLDLIMPKKDGWEVLEEIKAEPKFRRIPIVVLTISNSKEDVNKIFDMGAASYIPKPITFDSLADVIQTLGKYWFEIVELPV